MTASNVIFGRTVDGVEIVGPGSKVAVLFSVDGKIVGFDADWPKYKRLSSTQRMLDVASIRERATTLANYHIHEDEVDLKSFRCGYVDMGVGRHGRDQSAPIQGGCTASYVGRSRAFRNPQDPDDGSETSATAFYVPAGVDVAQDNRWPEVAAILKFGDISKASPRLPASNAAPPSAH